MKYIKRVLISLALLSGFVFTAIPAPAGAIDVFKDACSGVTNNAVCDATTNPKDNAGSVIRTVVNTFLYMAGAAAVIVIVIAGILYSTSGGETANVKRAKDMLTYAVIGLVVALLAYAIVNFVIARFS